MTTQPQPVVLPEVTDERVECAQWQPIEHDQIRAGMRIRATIAVWNDRTVTCSGVAHHTDKDGDWLTEGGLRLTGNWGSWGSWGSPGEALQVAYASVIHEVDSSTIPDPDADLIEAVAETLSRTDWPSDVWDGLSVEAYREVARAALAVIRAEEVGEQA